jgi:hypothetical protein
VADGLAAGRRRIPRLDVVALVTAGVVDLAAGADAGLLLSDGTLSGSSSELAERARWIAGNTAQWQAGWAFWFVVTTTFAWAFYALARNLDGSGHLRDLVVGAALLAAAVDIVGIVLNIAVLPDLAGDHEELGSDALLAATYSSVETLAQALTDIAAYGLYTTAGLLILPALFATRSYPRRLAWLGAVLWGVSAVVTVLLATDGPGATALFAVALLLYPLWVWGSARWLMVK